MKNLFFVLLLFCIGKSFSLELPNWVLTPPQNDEINFAVGISDKYAEIEFEKENAFDAGCYLLACQDKIIVKSEIYEVSGTNEFVYNHVVKPDSMMTAYYKENAIVIESYSDHKFSYVLVATQDCKVETQMIAVDQNNFPFETYSLEGSYFGYGIENYSSAVGLIYSTHSAITSLGQQIKSEVKSVYFEKDDFSIKAVNNVSELTITGIKPFKHYINYEKNIFVTYVQKD